MTFSDRAKCRQSLARLDPPLNRGAIRIVSVATFPVALNLQRRLSPDACSEKFRTLRYSWANRMTFAYLGVGAPQSRKWDQVYVVHWSVPVWLTTKVAIPDSLPRSIRQTARTKPSIRTEP